MSLWYYGLTSLKEPPTQVISEGTSVGPLVTIHYRTVDRALLQDYITVDRALQLVPYLQYIT